MDVKELLNDSANEKPESSSDLAPGVVSSLTADEYLGSPPVRDFNDIPALMGPAQLAGSLVKRPAEPHPAKPLDKKKWSREEDQVVTDLRNMGKGWEYIARHLGRSATSCRLRLQNYIERWPEWDEEETTRFARFYGR